MTNYLFWKRFAQGKLKTHVSSLKVRIPSPKEILSWSERRLPNSTLVGKVDNAHTVEHDTLRPVSGGLFCERIFGPIATNVCACLRKKGWNEDYCKICEVQFTKSRLRRYQMGHILLAAPVIHVWALQGGYLASLLGKKNFGIRSIAYGKVMSQSKLFESFTYEKKLTEVTGILASPLEVSKNPFNTQALHLLCTYPLHPVHPVQGVQGVKGVRGVQGTGDTPSEYSTGQLPSDQMQRALFSATQSKDKNTIDKISKGLDTKNLDQCTSKNKVKLNVDTYTYLKNLASLYRTIGVTDFSLDKEKNASLLVTEGKMATGRAPKVQSVHVLSPESKTESNTHKDVTYALSHPTDETVNNTDAFKEASIFGSTSFCILLPILLYPSSDETIENIAVPINSGKTNKIGKVQNMPNFRPLLVPNSLESKDESGSANKNSLPMHLVAFAESDASSSLPKRGIPVPFLYPSALLYVQRCTKVHGKFQRIAKLRHPFYPSLAQKKTFRGTPQAVGIRNDSPEATGEEYLFGLKQRSPSLLALNRQRRRDTQNKEAFRVKDVTFDVGMPSKDGVKEGNKKKIKTHLWCSVQKQNRNIILATFSIDRQYPAMENNVNMRLFTSCTYPKGTGAYRCTDNRLHWLVKHQKQNIPLPFQTLHKTKQYASIHKKTRAPIAFFTPCVLDSLSSRTYPFAPLVTPHMHQRSKEDVQEYASHLAHGDVMHPKVQSVMKVQKGSLCVPEVHINVFKGNEGATVTSLEHAKKMYTQSKDTKPFVRTTKQKLPLIGRKLLELKLRAKPKTKKVISVLSFLYTYKKHSRLEWQKKYVKKRKKRVYERGNVLPFHQFILYKPDSFKRISQFFDSLNKKQTPAPKLPLPFYSKQKNFNLHKEKGAQETEGKTARCKRRDLQYSSPYPLTFTSSRGNSAPFFPSKRTFNTTFPFVSATSYPFTFGDLISVDLESKVSAFANISSSLLLFPSPSPLDNEAKMQRIPYVCVANKTNISRESISDISYLQSSVPLNPSSDCLQQKSKESKARKEIENITFATRVKQNFGVFNQFDLLNWSNISNLKASKDSFFLGKFNNSSYTVAKNITLASLSLSVGNINESKAKTGDDVLPTSFWSVIFSRLRTELKFPKANYVPIWSQLNFISAFGNNETRGNLSLVTSNGYVRTNVSPYLKSTLRLKINTKTKSTLSPIGPLECKTFLRQKPKASSDSFSSLTWLPEPIFNLRGFFHPTAVHPCIEVHPKGIQATGMCTPSHTPVPVTPVTPCTPCTPCTGCKGYVQASPSTKKGFILNYSIDLSNVLSFVTPSPSYPFLPSLSSAVNINAYSILMITKGNNFVPRVRFKQKLNVKNLIYQKEKNTFESHVLDQESLQTTDFALGKAQAVVRTPIAITFGEGDEQRMQSKEKVKKSVNNAEFTGPSVLSQTLKNLNLVLLERLVDWKWKVGKKQLDSFLLQNKLTKKKRGLRNKLAKSKIILTRRKKLIQSFLNTKQLPEWMILSVLPVLPPALRPILELEPNNVVVSDLNTLYQTVIRRNDALMGLLTFRALEIDILNRQVSLQQAIEKLFDKGAGTKKRPVKSLSQGFHGKRGLFRLHLLGKRVDYSGRSVIVVGPRLKLHECGLPKEMALVLFLPFLIARLKRRKVANNTSQAKQLIIRKDKQIWSHLKALIYEHPVLLNRAPTLHRLGFQAFQPLLVSGKAIILPALVCTGFNADFDGDQMAVHVPLSYAARAESWKLLYAKNNMLSPATGKPIIVLSQEMILGCYSSSLVLNKTYLASRLILQRKSKQSEAQEGENSSYRIFQDKVNKPLIPFFNFCKKNRSYFTTFQEVHRALNHNKIALQTAIWLRIPSFEDNQFLEEPLEIRLDAVGHSFRSYGQSQRHFPKNTKSQNQIKGISYIRTSAGRIQLNEIFYSSLSV